MLKRIDPVARPPEPPERVAYATGVLLDASDFTDEQTYHRARLARALTWLHGWGTVAGLRVDWESDADGERLRVRPGMAIDRVGRIVELGRDACLRLDRWYGAQPANDLAAAFNSGAGGVFVDVFVRFIECPRGFTPAMAQGPFDATDAVQPARVRDEVRVELHLRREIPPPSVRPQWPDLSGVAEAIRADQLQDLLFDAWSEREGAWTREGLALLAEHVPNQDPTSTLLARLLLPASPGAAGERPVRTAGQPVTTDNRIRRFAYPVGALAAWLGL